MAAVARRPGAVFTEVCVDFDISKSTLQRRLAQAHIDDGMVAPTQKASLTRTRSQISPGKLQRHIDTLDTQLERIALTNTTAPVRPINRAFNKQDHPEI